MFCKDIIVDKIRGVVHQMYENFHNKLNMVLEQVESITPQMRNTINRLSDHHGYSATFIKNLSNGVSLYSIGGIYYKIRGDGTIL